MEFELHDDPAGYEARPIFATFNKRGITTFALIALILAPFLVLSFMNDWPVELTCVICAVVAGPIGIVGMGKKHGLYAEKWIPLMRQERRAPRELVWRCPRVTIDGMAPAPAQTRAELRVAKREAKADAKARKAEPESDAAFAFTLVTPADNR